MSETRHPVRLAWPIAWGEMDALGHVNNTVYFRWFESARIAYMARIGYPVAAGASAGPILASTACDFVRPLFYPGEVELAIGVSRLGGKSFTLEIMVSSEGEVAARGQAVMVWYDYDAEQSQTLPQALRDAVEALEAWSKTP